MDLRFLAVASKDLKILARDRMALAMLLGMPIALIVILSLALGPTFEGRSLDVNLPVVDYDQGEQSGRLIQILAGTDGVTVKKEAPDSELRVRHDVRDGNYLAALVIPEGFSQAVSAGQKAGLTLVLDPAKGVNGGVVRSVVENAAQRLVAKYAVPPGDTSRGAIEVTSQLAGQEGDRRPDVYEQNVPGYSVLAAFFLVMFLAGSILAERFGGTFRRLLSTPVRRSHIFLG